MIVSRLRLQFWDELLSVTHLLIKAGWGATPGVVPCSGEGAAQVLAEASR